MNELKSFYVTVCGGGACYEIKAINYSDARGVAVSALGTKWAFMYSDINDVHESDRRVISVISKGQV